MHITEHPDMIPRITELTSTCIRIKISQLIKKKMQNPWNTIAKLLRMPTARSINWLFNHEWNRTEKRNHAKKHNLQFDQNKWSREMESMENLIWFLFIN